MKIDEAWGDDQSLSVDRRFALQRARRNGGNAAPANADVAHGIEARFGIHHSSVGDHNIISLRKDRSRKKSNGQQAPFHHMVNPLPDCWARVYARCADTTSSTASPIDLKIVISSWVVRAQADSPNSATM